MKNVDKKKAPKLGPKKKQRDVASSRETVAPKKASAAKKKKKKRAAAKRGRPPERKEAEVLKLLGAIMDGKSLRKAVKLVGTPAKSSFLRWVSRDAKLRQHYIEALQIGALSDAGECVDIADNVRVEKTAIRKANLRIKTRQWAAQRLVPKVYGVRGVVEENSGDKNLAGRLEAARKRVRGGASG
jgi:hypothetical protein